MANYLDEIYSMAGDTLVTALDGLSKAGLQIVLANPDLTSKLAAGDKLAQAVYDGVSAKIAAFENEEAAQEYTQAAASHVQWLKDMEAERAKVADELKAQGKPFIPWNEESREAAIAAEQAAAPKNASDAQEVFAQSMREAFGNTTDVEAALDRSND